MYPVQVAHSDDLVGQYNHRRRDVGFDVNAFPFMNLRESLVLRPPECMFGNQVLSRPKYSGKMAKNDGTIWGKISKSFCVTVL